MNEEMMHIVKKDKKKLLVLGGIAVIAVFLLIVGSELSSSPREIAEESKVSVSDEHDMENELEQLLCSMAGVGDVAVIISYDGEMTELYAYNEERTEIMQENGTTEIREKKEIVLTDGDGAPVVVTREHPQIKGVLVSAEGASNDEVREDVVNAVASYLNIGKNRIEVTAMEVR